jgi:hypothetical protein
MVAVKMGLPFAPGQTEKTTTTEPAAMESMVMRSTDTPSRVATSLVKSVWNLVLDAEPAAPIILISTPSFSVTTLTTCAVGSVTLGSMVGGGDGGGGGLGLLYGGAGGTGGTGGRGGDGVGVVST